MIAALPAGFTIENIRLYLRLKWLIIVIVFLINLFENLTGITAFPQAFIAYLAIFFASFPALFLELTLRRNEVVNSITHLSLCSDIIAIILTLYFHGGLANSWLFLPIFVIFFAAYIFGFVVGLVYSMFAYLVILSMSITQYIGIIPYYPLFHLPIAHWHNIQYITDYMTGMFVLYVAAAISIGSMIHIATKRAERLQEYREKVENLSGNEEKFAGEIEAAKGQVAIKNAELEHLEVITAEQQIRLIELREELEKLKG